MNLNQAIVTSTEELFSSFVAMSASPGTPFIRTEPPQSESITGVIHYSGMVTGYAAIHMSKETANQVTRAFLFLEEEADQEQMHDALRELANILAGQMKALLDPQGSRIKLSLPMLSHGGDFIAEQLPGAVKMTIPFFLDDGDFFVEVQVCGSKKSGQNILLAS